MSINVKVIGGLTGKCHCIGCTRKAEWLPVLNYPTGSRLSLKR